MKKSLLIISLISLTIAACSKKNSPEPATPDNDMTTAKDAVKSYEVMNDVFLMAALTRDTYTATPFFGNTGITIKKDTVAKIDTLILTNALGTDKNIRNGKIIIKYSASTLNAKYFRQPGFKCNVELSNYSINTSTISAASIVISNTTPNGFNPNTTKLSWSAAYSNFTINDGTSSVIVTSTHAITLNNTNDASVYNNTGNIPIQWQNANINLTGNGSGSNSKGSFDITFNSPASDYLYRDFKNCAPEGFVKPGKHPFIKGLIYVKPNGKNAQKVDIGEGICDYNVKITINGNTYQTDIL
ncbi:MAG: hypothetical protein N2203_00915 [Bacteroidia bacterium]|nr:hypothetical protein [Bacteroidia bacterium]